MLRLPAGVSDVSGAGLRPELLLYVVQSESGRKQQQPAGDLARGGRAGVLQQNGREDEQAHRVFNHEVLKTIFCLGHFQEMNSGNVDLITGVFYTIKACHTAEMSS